MGGIGLLMAFGIGLTAASGCSGDKCAVGESRCDGSRILSCGSPGDITGDRDFTAESTGCKSAQCLDRTANGMRTAVCSTSGQPDSRCDGRDGVVCLNATTLILCQLGYSSFEQTCTGACIADPNSGAFCSVEAAPNVACTGKVGLTCADAAVVRCVSGYVAERISCSGNTPSCVQGTSSFHRSYCTGGDTCSGPDDTYCDGATTLRGCVAGHTVAMTCPHNTTCKAYATASSGHEAECAPSTSASR